MQCVSIPENTERVVDTDEFGEKSEEFLGDEKCSAAEITRPQILYDDIVYIVRVYYRTSDLCLL